MVDLPEISTEKLDDYAWTGVRLLIVGIVGSLIALPFDIAIFLIQGGTLAAIPGIIGLLVTGGLAIISLLIRLMSAGYAAKWLYDWE